MAEPSVSTDSPTVWDGLLDTKLHRPRLQRGFVPRRRLVDRLEESVSDRLVLVCAPAGFGKHGPCTTRSRS